MHLPLENIAPWGKESSWLCSALQEYMALAWLKGQKTVGKNHNIQKKYIYIQIILKNDKFLLVIGV